MNKNFKKLGLLFIILFVLMYSYTTVMVAKDNNTGLVALMIDKSIAYINYNKVYIDNDTKDIQPFICNERVLVPVRFISEVFNFDVLWDESSQTVTINNKSRNIILSIGSNKMIIDGKEILLDTTPQIQNGRIFIPLRALVENALNKNVTYANGLIIIFDSKDGNNFESNTDIVNTICDSFKNESDTISTPTPYTRKLTTFNTKTNDDLNSILYANDIYLLSSRNYDTSPSKGCIFTYKDIKSQYIQKYESKYPVKNITWGDENFIAVGGIQYDIKTDIYYQGVRLHDKKTYGTVFQSDDGLGWNKQYETTKEYLNTAFGHTGNFWAGGINTYSISSADSSTWSEIPSKPFKDLYGNVEFNSIAYNGSINVVVCSYGLIFTSNDLEKWDQVSVPTLQSLNKIIWDGKQFIAVGNDGVLLIASDPKNWTGYTIDKEIDIHSIATNGSEYFAVGENGSIFYTENDFSKWTKVESSIDCTLNDVVWDGKRFIMVGNSGTILIYE